jgi:hypothetical protein
VLAVVVVVVALLTPQPVDQGRGNVSTYSRAETGAQLVYELAGRMGWRVARRVAPLDTAIEASVTHVVLAPREDLGAHEVHHLLESVRRGGALIASVGENATLAESLRVAPSRLGRFVAPVADDSCDDAIHERRSGLFATPPVITGISWRGRPPSDLVTFANVATRPGDESPAAAGFTVGRGRVALVSDAELFTNDVLRVCRWQADLVVARLLEYARRSDGSSRRTTLVFDEYHHGYGLHPGSLRAIGRYLLDTPSGHAFVQLLAAGLVLLLAVAPRPIVPRDPERITRRSPLEHADALAHAYAEVGATRTITSRLLDGVRRRVGRHVSSAADADAFLQAVATTRPPVADDVERVQAALREPKAPRDLLAVGASLRRIEEVLTPTRGR